MLRLWKSRCTDHGGRTIKTRLQLKYMDDIVIIVALILLNGIFSMSEIALISARKSRLSTDARHGSKGAATAMKLAEDPDRFLSTIQIGITLIGILTGLYSGAAIADEVGAQLQQWGLQPRLAHTTGQILIVAAVTYLSIVVGELVPKRIGLAAANSVAKVVSRPMHLLSVAAMPLVWLLSVSTAFFVKVLGLKKNANSVTEDEIKSLIQDGTDAGEVREVEQEIMERALILGDLRVSSIMTPKIDVATLSMDMSAEEIKRQLAEELHSSYPVRCLKEKHDICGVVSLKQLILTIDNPGFRLEDVTSDPLFFPETMTVYDALDRLKSKNEHFALVCDEFGELAGVVTPSDILEGLVGVLSAQTGSQYISPADGNDKWCVDAQIPFYDFLHHFELEDLYSPASYSTLGGFLLEELKYLPAVGEKLTWNNISFEIASMDSAKIGKVIVEIDRPEPSAVDDNAD